MQKVHAEHIASYSQQMQEQRNHRTASRAKGMKRSAQNSGKTHRSGIIPNQKEVRGRIQDVKVHPQNQGVHIWERVLKALRSHDKIACRDWSDPPIGLDERCYHKRWS